MSTSAGRIRGHARRTSVVTGVAVITLAVLTILLLKPQMSTRESRDRLILFCAAGIRLPIEKIRHDFERECGVPVDVQYGGSNTLLSQLQVSRAADLYLAADDAYLAIAREKGLIRETVPIAGMVPVIVVPRGNPEAISGVVDLMREGLRVAMGNPDQAAIGKHTREALRASGHWEELERHVTKSGVFKPTVPDIANTVEIGSVDAGIVWSATAAQYDGLDVVHAPELDAGASRITIGVTAWSKPAATALNFARYVAGRNRGLVTFKRMGYEPVPGDPWTLRPELTLFAGSVNRRAMEPVIRRFEAREGVRVNTVYNGCGILTAQMRTIRQADDPGFPDAYIACDVYYLDTVAELFEQGTRVSETDIVVVVAEGNPKNIRTPEDLVRPGVRVAIGQPDQCTIGVLSRRLLEDANLYQRLLKNNVVTQTATSALLVPAVTTGSADAALAYRTDTLAEAARTDVIDIDSPLAKAVQPFAIARGTQHKQLAARLFETIRGARQDFETAGFRWRLTSADTDKRAP
ncbi:MAG: molybdate ABC transporter substrate-binding protein [Lentisphaerae bacterium]|nr:molybdate ABC transporter substrate-binding protein [Lentisphaerota bacterium]